jgi:hypothetical protein
VSFTVVAIAPGEPDMTFTVAGLANPTIIIPAQARVTVRFINNDTNEAHGWLVTTHKPPFAFGQPATPAIAGGYAGGSSTSSRAANVPPAMSNSMSAASKTSHPGAVARTAKPVLAL